MGAAVFVMRIRGSYFYYTLFCSIFYKR